MNSNPTPTTDWESRYQQGDTPWDKGAASPPLHSFLERQSLAGNVLVPGCGTGHDVRLLARHGLTVTGLDISETALALARKSTPSTLPIQWQLGDFFQLPSHCRGAFDGLFEHTCFCAIPPELRPEYARSTAFAVKPGGFYLAVFYRDPGSDDGPPFGCTTAELEALFGADFELLAEETPTVGYEGRVGRELLRFYRRRGSAPVVDGGKLDATRLAV
jgi:SAM-dependent methyltransferase